nr:hypothetical protein [Actinomycetota bacterium]
MISATVTLPTGAPLAAQYIVALAPVVPADVRALPITSARYRRALRDAARAAGWPMHPSRRELSRGASYLASKGVAL